MKKDERLYLNSLSKKLFGSSSKWQKMINKGEITRLERTNEAGEKEFYLGIDRWNLSELKLHMEELNEEEKQKEIEESAKAASEAKEETVENG